MPLSGIPYPIADVEKRCPYLGLNDDPETALGFPSRWNYCHRVKTIAPPILAFQSEICLTPKHITCPIIDIEQQKFLPKKFRLRETGATRKLLWRWALVVLFLTLLIIGGLIFSGYWVPSWVEKTSIPAWVNRVIPQKTMINVPEVAVIKTSIPTGTMIETDTVTPGKIILAETPSPSRESIAATQTELALLSRCAFPLESPFGSENSRFLFHKVEGGENMEKLTEQYEIPQNEIDAVNYFLPSPLWAEHVIIIPLDIRNSDDLPSFRPVLLDEEDISLDELAQNLLVSSSELIEFNQLDPSCRSFYGWILVPAEKITP